MILHAKINIINININKNKNKNKKQGKEAGGEEEEEGAERPEKKKNIKIVLNPKSKKVSSLQLARPRPHDESKDQRPKTYDIEHRSGLHLVFILYVCYTTSYHIKSTYCMNEILAITIH